MNEKLENANKYRGNGGVGFLGGLTILFIALKLLGEITWPWIWVLAPMWLPIAIALAILLIVLVVYLIAN
jgi:hypothetical protein